jgi:hypothetical protein
MSGAICGSEQGGLHKGSALGDRLLGQPTFSTCVKLQAWALEQLVSLLDMAKCSSALQVWELEQLASVEGLLWRRLLLTGAASLTGAMTGG